MNMMKLALLGTAALAAGSLSARADELSDMKAQIEALNTRLASVEAAPAVPAGYQLMSISKGEAMKFGLDSDAEFDRATIISIMPTADAPAGTELQISGFARAALVARNDNWDDDEAFGVRSRGEVKIGGKTDTAVGEVSAFVKLRANAGTGKAPSDVTSPEYWGSWAFADGLSLGGGYTGSLSGIGYGYDGQCNCYYTDNANAGYGHGDTSQMRLSYASGPISFAIALEDDGTLADVKDDPTTAANETVLNGDDAALGVAAEMKFSGDMVSGEVSGGWWNNDGAGPEDAFQAAVGLGFKMDMFSVGVSAGYFNEHSGAETWKANILASASISDSASFEIGFNHVESNAAGGDQDAAMAGIYYTPVSQLVIGLEAEWINPEGASNTKTQVDLVTVYKF